MTQNGQSDDKKENTRLQRALDKLRLETAEKHTQLLLAKQKIEYLTEQNTKLQEKSKLLEERSAKLEEKERLFDLKTQEVNHLKESSLNEIEHLKESSLKALVIQHGLNILTAISLGLGINFITSTPTNSPGLALIFIGVGAESISFYITYMGVKKNHE